MTEGNNEVLLTEGNNDLKFENFNFESLRRSLPPIEETGAKIDF